MSRRTEEAGAASVLAVMLVALLAFAALGGASAAVAVAAHRHAQAAADLAALAGAAALQEVGEPCGPAGSLAARNRARLVSCEVQGEEVVVRVQVRVGDLVGGRWTLTSTARSGPVSAVSG